MIKLASTLKVRNTTIKNRIVMPPMVCFGFGNENGMVTDQHILHYESRAKGGVGLIIVEATCIEKTARLSPNQLGLWSDDQIPGFNRIAQACHLHGAKVIVQIHHGGLNTYKSVTSELLAPSNFRGVVRGEMVSARELTVPEIHKIQQEYVAAALRAKKAGLDGIEFHGAHGFLISQFFSPIINNRNDRYGGNLDNRTRFITEIIPDIRRVTGNDFLIDCRLGCNEPDLETSIQIAKILEDSGFDLLHTSAGFTFPTEKEPGFPNGFKYSWIVYGGTKIKENVRIPVIVVNGIRTPEQAAYLVEHELTDFVAIGTGQLADPEWANKAINNLPIIPCLNCQPCRLFTPEGVCVQHKGKTKLIAP
jgi:NADPH2 dehydrogenase